MARIIGSGDNIMKRIEVLGATALVLLLGFATAVEAGQERGKPQKEEQAKPEQRGETKAPQQQQAKPAQPQARAPQQQQQQARPAQPQARAPQQPQAKPAQQQTRAPQQQQQAKPAQQARAPQQQQANPAQAHPQTRTPQPAQQANSRQPQARAPQQAASGQRPPQRTQQAMATQRSMPAIRLSVRSNSRIPDERFHASFGREHAFRMVNPVMVGGYSRFQYGGFWFGFVQPWPVGWYYTDDVYIDYVDGGYYMYDPYYPGARFAISVVL
jgi:hypothetical protein